MIQPLHIFRKDSCHLWPELLVYAALLITYSWAEPEMWSLRAISEPAHGWIVLFLSLLRPLFPILWLVMIARLVQDESLVGDQQFWITRPYGRLSLLGAKLLFIIVCIALPFGLMQCYLLLHAGLMPLATLPGLLSNLFYLSLVCWLPFMAVASVTSTLPRMMMSIIGAFVAFFLFTIIVTLHLLAKHTTPPFVDPAFKTLFALMLVAILAWQYGTRSTTTARISLVAIPLLLVILRSTAPADFLFRHGYPVVAETSLSRLVFDPNPMRRGTQTSSLQKSFGLEILNLPIQPSGPTADQPNAPARFLFEAVGASYTIDAPGFHYTSPWQPATLDSHNVSMYISESVFYRLGGRPVHLHVTLAADRLLPGMPQTITATSSFNIPGHGHCISPQDLPSSDPICRYGYTAPPPTMVRRVPIAVAPGVVRLDDVYKVHVSAPEPSFDPVLQDVIRLKGGAPMGAQLTFTTYQSVDKIRTEFDIPVISLTPYLAP